LSTVFPNLGLNSPAYSYQEIQYSDLLTDPFETDLWIDLTDSFTQLYDGVVHFAEDQLYLIRTPGIDPLITAYNTRMLGFQVPLYSFTNDQYTNLLQSLGTFYQTKGASVQFLNFLAYIEGTQFSLIPLYANSLSNTISQLTDTPGSFIWNGGTYFATPYCDLQYSESDYPNLNLNQFINILYKISPIYLVFRSIAFITSTTTAVYMTPVTSSYEVERTVATH